VWAQLVLLQRAGRHDKSVSMNEWWILRPARPLAARPHFLLAFMMVFLFLSQTLGVIFSLPSGRPRLVAISSAAAAAAGTFWGRPTGGRCLGAPLPPPLPLPLSLCFRLGGQRGRAWPACGRRAPAGTNGAPLMLWRARLGRLGAP